MGIRVQIFTDGRAYGGIAERGIRELTLVNVDGNSVPSEDAPAAMLVSNAMGTAKVVLADEAYDGSFWEHAPGGGIVGPMMGGTYVAAPGSQFREAVERLLGHKFYGAVPLHDRYETVEVYNRMSM